MTMTRGPWWAWRRLRWEEPKRRAGGRPAATIGGPSMAHGAAEVLIVGVVGFLEEERHSALKVEDVVTGAEDGAAGPGRCMMLITPVDGLGATDEVDLRGEVGTEREPISGGLPPA